MEIFNRLDDCKSIQRKHLKPNQQCEENKLWKLNLADGEISMTIKKTKFLG